MAVAALATCLVGPAAHAAARRGSACGTIPTNSIPRKAAPTRAASPAPARAPLHHQAAALYLAERPDIFLFHPEWLFAMSAGVKGFVPSADGPIRPRGLSVE